MSDAEKVEALKALLEDVQETLEKYSDVRDGQDGPKPNPAMSMLQEIQTVLAQVSR